MRKDKKKQIKNKITKWLKNEEGSNYQLCLGKNVALNMQYTL